MEKVTTRVFGEIGVEEEKVITFPGGIVGFPDLRRFKLIYDEDKGSNVGIRWLQSIDEPMFAIPVMDPLLVNTKISKAPFTFLPASDMIRGKRRNGSFFQRRRGAHSSCLRANAS